MKYNKVFIRATLPLIILTIVNVTVLTIFKQQSYLLAPILIALQCVGILLTINYYIKNI